jgi:hypothetical protein
MPRRLLIIEPGVGARPGHFINGVRAFAKLADGFAVEAAVSNRFSGDLSPIGTVHCCLPVDSVTLNRIRHYHPAARLRAMLGRNPTVAAPVPIRRLPTVLHALFRRFDGTSKDMVLFPSGDAEWLAAIAACHQSLRQGPRILFRVMYDDASWHPEFPRLEAVLSSAPVREALSGGLKLLAETRAMADWMAEKTGFPVPVLMQPPSPGIAPRHRELPQTPVILIPGRGRADKGGQRLQRIAALLDQRATAKGVALALRADFRGASFIGKSLQARSFGDLSESAYAAEFSTADVALLIHEPAVFARRGSGVAADALHAALPLVVPAGTALADLVANGNGLRFNGDEEAIDSCLRLISQYERYAAASLTAAGEANLRLATTFEALLSENT